jgi:hypothetical protein
MEVAHRRENSAWIAGLDFGSASFGCRSDQTQLIEVDLPLVDWTVLFLAAPMNHGLHLLRVYQAFNDSLQRYFSPYTEQGLDGKLGDDLDRLLRRLKIPKKSIHAYQCFGVLPHLWGKRFYPREPIGTIANRLNSVAVPTDRAPQAIEYFAHLADEFGRRCVALAPENTRLYIDQRAIAADGGLFLGLTSRMSETQLENVRKRLAALVESDQERMTFLDLVDPSLKISGAVRAPYLMDIIEGAEETCREIARLRLELARLLRWPHALENVRFEIAEGSVGTLETSYLPWLDEALVEYPAIHCNPMR